MKFIKHIKKIGGCTVVSRIGKGRYGVCFLARDAYGTKVILKRFRRRMWEKNRENNHHEAVILSGLCHPGIPELLGVVNDRRGYYFILGYMEGNTLADWLFDKKKIFSAEEMVRIGLQLFGLLEYLHSRSVVHGDISITNVVDDGERVSLIDFGLARYAGTDRSEFGLDYACAANVLIYLLYSGYSGKGDRPWYEELPLTEEQRKFLMELMEPDNRQSGVDRASGGAADVKAQFQKCFGEPVCLSEAEKAAGSRMKRISRRVLIRQRRS